MTTATIEEDLADVIANWPLRVLIVEDNERTAELHSKAVSEFADTTRVLTPDAAFTMMMDYPAFDVVVSDLSFASRGKSNAAGEAVGKWVRDNHYPAFTFLCSAAFRENDVEFIKAKEQFDGVMPKDRGPDEYENLRNKGQQKLLHRVASSKLVVDPGLAESRSTALRRAHSVENSLLCDDNEVQNHITDGFDLIAVQPSKNGFRAGGPFLVWSKSVEGGVFLEVYGHPNLLAFNDSLETSLDSLNDVLLTAFLDLSNGQNGKSLEYTQKFLCYIYSGWANGDATD